ncbi:MAG: hypothetical protein LBV79_07275 [Candidatus Adiutrix sp.]|jgi:hypothetical protein|nr:hypothetical protein [Candidatus Adiutrix sp.]
MKTKASLILTALMMIVLAVACSSGPSAQEAYEIFSLVMDKTAGPGQWTAKEHSMKGDVLVVSGVSVKLPAPTPAEAAGEAAAPAANLTLEIAAVELGKPLAKADMEKVFAAADWRDQKAAKLAESLVLKGLALKGLELDGDAPEIAVEEVALAAVGLSAAGADAPAGKAGFLKALTLGKLSYKNFTFKLATETPEGDRVEMSSALALAAMEGVNFGGDAIPGMEAIDPSGFFSVMSGMSAKSAAMSGLTATFGGDDAKGSFSIASIKETDVKPLGSIGSVIMDDLKFSMGGKELESDMGGAMTGAVKNMSMTGFDMSAYFKKYMPVFLSALEDPEAASEAMTLTQTLGDLLVSPFSLKEASVSGLEFKLGELFGISMAEAKVTGPYVAGEIPAIQKSTITGFVVTLPSADPGDATQSFKGLYLFTQYFGMNRFELSASGESTYDPAKGLWRKQLTSLSVKDLFDLSGALEFGGLTAERVAKFKESPLGSLVYAMMAPGELLGDFSFNGLNIKLDDKGLTNRVFKYIAAQQAENPGVSEAEVEAFKTQAVAMVELMVGMGGGEYLANPADLGKSVADFLRAPGSLEIKLSAQPSLTFQAVEAAGGDPKQSLKSLNITLSANGQAAPALKFNIPN